MTRLTVTPDAETAARRAADLLAEAIRTAPGEVHLALAGGTTPRRAYELLAAEPLGWEHVHLWLGDERCVPFDHPDANQRMVAGALLGRASGARLHGVRGEKGPEDAAWLYARELVGALGDEPVLDVVLLGLGEDGHTASLFPGDPAAFAAEAPVIGVRGSPKPPPERISMTMPLLRRARLTLLLTAGAGKRAALDRVRANDEAAPAGRLGAALDEIVCDEAAAGAAAGSPSA